MRQVRRDERGARAALPLLFAAVACLLAPAATASPEGPPPLTPERFAELHAALVPTGPACWEEVPWRTGLLEARALAVRSGRPIFLWAMNGHPLGCT